MFVFLLKNVHFKPLCSNVAFQSTAFNRPIINNVLIIDNNCNMATSSLFSLTHCLLYCICSALLFHIFTTPKIAVEQRVE